jgi:2-amino-4-hydroxy-6-hydroxymethyldihydropteridine diphosphokinase
MSEHRAVIALGSNLGDREATIRAAVAEIDALDEVAVVAASGLVETPALTLHGVDHAAPAYVNAVLIVRTALAPLALLDELIAIEDAHGRRRGERWGDRTLDLDIVTIDGVAMASERLTLPHPQAGDRGFVLVPWLQADADAVLPGHGPVAALLAALHDEVRPVPAAPLIDRATA